MGEYVTDLKAWLFLSTPSARRATDDNTFIQTYFQFLSTPSARRATASGRQRHHQRRISIHALREEGDILHSAGVASLQIFLSTPSARRATVVVLRVVGCQFGFLSTPSARRATNLR